MEKDTLNTLLCVVEKYYFDKLFLQIAYRDGLRMKNLGKSNRRQTFCIPRGRQTNLQFVPITATNLLEV